MFKGISKVMKKRMTWAMIFFIGICMPILIIRLFTIQIVDHNKYQAMAIDQQTRDAVVNPSRGVIYDRNMNELAVSATVETVLINPKAVGSEEMARKISDGLAEILNVKSEDIYKKTQINSYYQIVKRQVEKEEADKVREFILQVKTKAITLVEDTKRYYTNGNLASSVIGFTNIDGDGIEGIEAYYNDYLKGSSGRIITAKNAVGTDMPFEYQTYVDAKDGSSLVLTIDSTVQHYTDKYLEQALTDANVKNKATAIVMNVKTGEILAMSTKPDYNLNAPREIVDEAALEELSALTGEEYNKKQFEIWQGMWRNKAISDTYEPGSIFKLITSSMGLEEGVVKVNDTFVCTGSVAVGNRRVKCWKTIGHGHETFAQGLNNSCNPVFMAVSARVGARAFYDYLTAFGFREKTGIDLFGETKGILHDYDTLSNPISLAVSAFGQTFKVTPIQMVTAISAVVNGGNLMEPHLVKQVIDNEGNVIKNIDPVVKRQVISEETSKTMAALMQDVVKSGTGKNAYIKGYRVGGKTATSEKRDQLGEAGATEKYVASFVAIAPADDPLIACLVVLDEPDMPTISGGALAGPVCRNILTEVLPYLGVTPIYTADEMASLEVKVENYVGKTIEEAQKIAKASGHKLKVIGNGSAVFDQIPRGGTMLSQDGTILLYSENNTNIEIGTVPDVSGLTLAQATNKLQAAGFNISINGNYFDTEEATAVSQSAPANTQLQKGTIISVSFTNLNILDG